MFVGMTELMIMKLFRDARGLARKYAETGPARRLHPVHGRARLDRPVAAAVSRRGGMCIGGFMGGGSMGLNTLLNQMDSLGELVEDRWRHKILRWFGLHPRARPRTSRSSSSSARPTDPRCWTRR